MPSVKVIVVYKIRAQGVKALCIKDPIVIVFEAVFGARCCGSEGGEYGVKSLFVWFTMGRFVDNGLQAHSAIRKKCQAKGNVRIRPRRQI